MITPYNIPHQPLRILLQGEYVGSYLFQRTHMLRPVTYWPVKAEIGSVTPLYSTLARLA